MQKSKMCARSFTFSERLLIFWSYFTSLSHTVSSYHEHLTLYSFWKNPSVYNTIIYNQMYKWSRETLFPVRLPCFSLHGRKEEWFSFLFFFSFKGVLECVKCRFYFFSLEVWNDSLDFMACIMQSIALFFLNVLFITIILISSVHIVFPVDKSSGVAVSPEWTHSFTHSCKFVFLFPLLLFRHLSLVPWRKLKLYFGAAVLAASLYGIQWCCVLGYDERPALVWLEWEWGREWVRQGEFFISQQDD